MYGQDPVGPGRNSRLYISGPILLLAIRIAITITLYAFLAWALYTLWMDIRRQSKLMSSKQVPSLRPHPESRGRYTLLPVLNSRGHDAFLATLPVISALENRTISVKHARLTYHHGHWWAENMHSTNGPFINQRPLQTTPSSQRDRLRCGQVELLISIGESMETGV